MGGGVVGRHDGDRGGGVVEPGGVAGGDGEALDLGVERLELAEGVGGDAAAGVLVDREGDGAAVERRGLDRHDLALEPAVVDRLDGLGVGVGRPLVDVAAGEAHLEGGVVAHGDGHVEGRGVGGLAVARRHPRLGVLAEGEALERRGRGGDALGATGDDDVGHAGHDRGRPRSGWPRGRRRSGGCRRGPGPRGGRARRPRSGRSRRRPGATRPRRCRRCRRWARRCARWRRRRRPRPAGRRRHRRGCPCWRARSGCGRRRRSLRRSSGWIPSGSARWPSVLESGRLSGRRWRRGAWGRPTGPRASRRRRRGPRPGRGGPTSTRGRGRRPCRRR